MKTIRIKDETRKRLDIFKNELSYNKALRKLLESANEVDEVVECNPQYKNIKLDDDLVLKLKKCKKYSNESHSDTIERLLDEYNQKQ